MIGKKGKLLWIFYVVMLVLLFLLSSTDLIIKEKQTEIYPISVIIGDATDENYVNFRKGMEQAAIEFNADVRFITLYETGDGKQQVELVLREQQDGAEALIVAPVNGETADECISSRRSLMPLVLLQSEYGGESAAGTAKVTFDFMGMGQALGEAICAEQERQAQVLVLTGAQADESSTLFGDGIRRTLTTAGFQTFDFAADDEETLRERLVLTAAEGKQTVVAAVSQDSLLTAAKLLSEDEVCAAAVCGLYGRGVSLAALNFLDKGTVDALCVTDDFSAGYLSVKKAVELITDGYTGEPGYLKSGLVRRGDLQSPAYEKMLYPIE